jgi:ComF family protein
MFKQIRQLINQYQYCQLCHSNQRDDLSPLCQACYQHLPWHLQQFEIQGHIIQAICHYEWPINQLIHQFKYQRRTQHLALLSYILLQAPKPQVHALVPVPMSHARLVERGFNQTLLLAKQLSKHWQIPVWQPIEKQHRPAQQQLDRSERLSNLQHAYSEKRQGNRIVPRRVLLIDDVVTTGSTLLHLSKSLHELGVLECRSLVLARAN